MSKLKLSYSNEFLSYKDVRHGVGKLRCCILRWCAPPSICTHQAHYRHTSGTHQAQHFDRSFLKIIDVPFVCHMCAHTWWHYYRFRIEKYGQFPFQRRVARQKRTFLAPCGSGESLASFGNFQHVFADAQWWCRIMVILHPH